MDRRSFIKTTAAIGLAAMVPTWLKGPERPPFNLKAFCLDDNRNWQWSMTNPFTQQTGNSFVTYATDCRIIVRVAGDYQDGADNGKSPPAERLWWDHDKERGWRHWPKLNWVNKPDAQCVACRGGGGKGHCNECEVCGGTGNEWIGAYECSRPTTCSKCNGIGTALPHCESCKGKGYGDFPRHQAIGHAEISVAYDQLIRKECGEAEYVIIRRPCAVKHGSEPSDLVLFRFAAGTGILVPLIKGSC